MKILARRASQTDKHLPPPPHTAPRPQSLPKFDRAELQQNSTPSDALRVLGLMLLPFVGMALGFGCLLATAANRFELVILIGAVLIAALAAGGVFRGAHSGAQGDVSLLGLPGDSDGDGDFDFD